MNRYRIGIVTKVGNRHLHILFGGCHGVAGSRSLSRHLNPIGGCAVVGHTA